MTAIDRFPTRLRQGYEAFQRGRLARERARYRRLAETGQSPETMVIGCSDSRVAPEVIFDAGPGELFVVRNVANLVPPYAPDGELHGTSAALEFAVMALKVRNIVVLGHGRCGGVRAFRDPGPAPLSPGDFIGRWITLLEPAASRLACEGFPPGEDPETALERASVRQSIQNLRSFPCIGTLEARGRLTLHGAWFDIGEGILWVLDEAAGRFVRASGEAPASAAPAGAA